MVIALVNFAMLFTACLLVLLVTGIPGRCSAKKSDDWHRRLLRTRQKRPSDRRTAENGDELTPTHVPSQHVLSNAQKTSILRPSGEQKTAHRWHQTLIRPDVRSGSKTEVSALPSYVCVTPQSRHQLPRPRRPCQ